MAENNKSDGRQYKAFIVNYLTVYDPLVALDKDILTGVVDDAARVILSVDVLQE